MKLTGVGSAAKNFTAGQASGKDIYYVSVPKAEYDAATEVRVEK